MTAIAIIPARGGSRRVPRKNIRAFHGRPIITYTIQAAWDTGLFERVIVSTDDDEIARIASSFQSQIHMRPHRLSEDSAGTLEVIGDVARKFSREYQYVCGLYATSPMMRPSDIVRAFENLRFSRATHCISVGTEPLRDAAQFYWSTMEGAAGECEYFTFATSIEPVPENRICDVNTPEDWTRAEEMYAALHKEKA